MTPDSPSPLRSRASRPTRTHDRVSFEGTTIEYRVRRSPRRKKTIEFSLTPDGLLVSAPARASYALIRSIVLGRAPKLLKLLADSPNGGRPLAFVTGDSLPYLGCSYPMVVQNLPKLQNPIVELDAESFRVSAPPTLDDEERRDGLRKAFEAWYRARAQDYIPPLGRCNGGPGWASGRSTGSLLGPSAANGEAAAPDGALRFSWRNMMLPPDAIEYVIVHELGPSEGYGPLPRVLGSRDPRPPRCQTTPQAPP